MSISSKDLKIIEDAAGYGAVATVNAINEGLSITIGKHYEGIGWVGGTLRMSFDEVDALNNDKTEIYKFAEQAEKVFSAKLAGKFYR